jgi:hypothetical protein
MESLVRLVLFLWFIAFLVGIFFGSIIPLSILKNWNVYSTIFIMIAVNIPLWFTKLFPFMIPFSVGYFISLVITLFIRR